MMPPLARPGDAPAASLGRTYGYTSLFCIAIALFLWLLDPSQSLSSVTLVSFCIGLSIATAFVLLEDRLSRHLSPYVALLPITLIGLSVGLVLGGTLLGDPGYFFGESRETWVIGIFFGVLGFLLMGTHGRVLSLHTALARAEAERLTQEKQRLETELRLLQAQIEPHFLFNTLSNVASMIPDAPDQAEATLVDLTTLLRASLRRTRASVTTLGLEIEILRSYLDIQRIRMGDRLRYRIDVDESLHGASLPPLLLQPLVENAVVHGIEPVESGGEIRVRAARRGDRLIVRVSDTGCGLPETSGDREMVTGSGLGTGIANVLGRLSALYHGQATLRFARNEPHGLVAILDIPINDHDHSATG